MDIATTTATNTTTNLNTTTNAPTTKSPDQDTETPTRIQQPKPLSFTNGVLKRHHPHHHHHHHHHHLTPPLPITYKECLKNHAATIGGHALDGCGEFMPSPTATPTDPTSLKCAACGCHRNFHRRDPEDSPPLPPPTPTTTTIEYQPHHRHHPPPPPQAPPVHRSPNSASPPPISSSYPSAPHMLLALSGGLNENHHHHQHHAISVPPAGSSTRKRFRTKFSQGQKDKMFEFAERVGWKMQKRDEDLVLDFCNEVGVDKTVLKVWMHNNKNTLAKKDANGTTVRALSNHTDNNNNSSDEIKNDNSNNHGQDANHHHHNHNHHLFENDSVAHVGTNGSSSSS